MHIQLQLDAFIWTTKILQSKCFLFHKFFLTSAFVKPLASHRASPQKPPQPCAATNVINTGVSPSSKARLIGQYIQQLKSLQELRELLHASSSVIFLICCSWSPWAESDMSSAGVDFHFHLLSPAFPSQKNVIVSPLSNCLYIDERSAGCSIQRLLFPRFVI